MRKEEQPIVERLREGKSAGTDIRWKVTAIHLEAADRIEALQAEIEQLKGLLAEHHNWHLNVGEIGIPDGEGGWVSIENGSEYSDCGLYQRTGAALNNVPDIGYSEEATRANAHLQAGLAKRVIAQSNRATTAESEAAALRKRVEELESEIHDVHENSERAFKGLTALNAAAYILGRVQRLARIAGEGTE